MSNLDDLAAAGLVEVDVPLAPLTTYKLGGPTRYFAEVASPGDLEKVVSARLSTVEAGIDVPVLILGRGSNMAVADRGFDGITIRLAGIFNAIEIGEDGVVTTGGATPLPLLARRSVKEGRGGLEFLVGIPGSVGGAVRMNAGCHGSETAEWLIEAHVIDLGSGTTSVRDVSSLEMSYRHSNLTANELVMSARWRSVESTPGAGEATLREITAWRRESQPGGTLNAGSVFKNPPEAAAGKLIDDAGLKGFTVGKVSVSTKHANFFVAQPGATAGDVFKLVLAVRQSVGETTGIWLEPELRFVGAFEANEAGES